MLTFDAGPTQKVFSDMISTKENRAIFIQNLFSFMRQYAFDGVDLDWVRDLIRLIQLSTLESEVQLTPNPPRSIQARMIVVASRATGKTSLISSSN